MIITIKRINENISFKLIVERTFIVAGSLSTTSQTTEHFRQAETIILPDNKLQNGYDVAIEYSYYVTLEQFRYADKI